MLKKKVSAAVAKRAAYEPTATVEIKAVSKVFPGHAMISEIKLNIEEGEFVAFVGRPGSGPEVVVKLINGMIMPDEGEVWTDGDWVQHTDVYKLRKRIGYLSGDVGLLPHLTVAENIVLGLKLDQWAQEDIDERLAELQEQFDISTAALHRRPRALSALHASRVGLARALAARPSIVLLVNPFSRLDPYQRDELYALYRTVHEDEGLTSVAATSDPAMAGHVDRIVAMAGGIVMADGAPADLIAGKGGAFVSSMLGAAPLGGRWRNSA